MQSKSSDSSHFIKAQEPEIRGIECMQMFHYKHIDTLLNPMQLKTLLDGHGLKSESARSVWAKVNAKILAIIVIHVGKATVSTATKMVWDYYKHHVESIRWLTWQSVQIGLPLFCCMFSPLNNYYC
jgi:hypothetical protein